MKKLLKLKKFFFVAFCMLFLVSIVFYFTNTKVNYGKVNPYNALTYNSNNEKTNVNILNDTDMVKETLTNEKEQENNKIVFDPSKELVVDFETIKKDVEEFRDYDARLTQFHACSVRGALYIDSKELRGILTPIPINSIRAIQTALNDLIQKKIEDITKIFRFCSKQLKKEPGTLEQYVNHCDFTSKAHAMDPFIKNEMIFVDGLLNLYEYVCNSTNNHVEQSRNPISILLFYW